MHSYRVIWPKCDASRPVCYETNIVHFNTRIYTVLSQCRKMPFRPVIDLNRWTLLAVSWSLGTAPFYYNSYCLLDQQRNTAMWMRKVLHDRRKVFFFCTFRVLAGGEKYFRNNVFLLFLQQCYGETYVSRRIKNNDGGKKKRRQ